jgi:membrane associated rhomboid family serine protease
MNSILFDSPATLILLIVTIVLSLLSFSNGNLWRFLALEPYRMWKEHEYHQLITSGFIHADLGHLFINMMTLYFFGPELETTVGGEWFVIIYVVSLITGSLFPFIKYRNTPNYVAIGASGAISGILFSFCRFYPGATILALFAIPMPAAVYAVLYVIYSIYSMRSRRDNIGHEAHLAGAIGGLIITLIAFPPGFEVGAGSP